MEKVYLNNRLLESEEYTISVIGTGGTGSYLIERLATLTHGIGKTKDKIISLTAYDFDEVEPKNVGRSSFYNGDNGLSKSEVCISKANIGYGLRWQTARVSDFEPANFNFICTDSMESRIGYIKLIKEHYKNNTYSENTPYYIFDVGNDKGFGQIVILDTKGKLQDIDRTSKSSETIGTVSCSEREWYDNQGLFINQFMALYAAESLWKLLTEYNIDYNQMFINTDLMRISTQLKFIK